MMIALFYAMFLVLLPIGIGMYFTTISVIIVEKRYDNLCTMTPNSNTAPECNITTLGVTIPTTMAPPVYMYYRIKGFYQNYRLYAKSRYDGQLAGHTDLATSDLSDCAPFQFYGDRNNLNGSYTINDVYMPCGLVAWSMFNDTFKVYSGDKSPLCNGPQPDGANCTKSGIGIPGMRIMQFKRGAYGRNYTTQYYGELGHYLPDVIDEDFQVWATTSAIPDFRKLYRIINVPLTGTIYIDINQRWPVANFSGEKSIVFSTASWIGGNNLVFSIMNMAVGGIAFIVGTAFFFAFVVRYIVMRARDKKQKTDYRGRTQQ
jgi:hypothetical protein